MSSLFLKHITGIPNLMDTTQDESNPLDRISKVTSPASVASSTEGPIHSDRIQRRVGSPYRTGKGPGCRVYNQGSSRRQGSPRPRDEHATFLLALAKRAETALRHLDGKITTNQVKTEYLSEQVQGQVQEIQDLRQEVEEGKQLDSEKAAAFEAVIIAVGNATAARRDEFILLAKELEESNARQRALDARQSHHEGVSTQLYANIEQQGQASTIRTQALEQEVIDLRAHHTADVKQLQQVVQQQADAQKKSAEEQSRQMALMMTMLTNLQPTPTTTIPAPPVSRFPAPQVATTPDHMQRWTHERREQEFGTQRPDKGKQPQGYQPRGENQGGGNQEPPRPPPPPGNDQEPSEDGSDHGHGGGDRQGPSWQPERPAPVDPQVAMFAEAIGLALARSGKRQANEPLPFKNHKHQNVKLWLLRWEDYFKRNPHQWSLDQDCIKHVFSQMEGDHVSAFALTYRKKMTGELGHLKVEGYEYWETF